MKKVIPNAEKVIGCEGFAQALYISNCYREDR